MLRSGRTAGALRWARRLSGGKGADAHADPVLQRTLVLVKPEALQRGLAFRILARFEDRGYQLLAVSLRRASAELARAHYEGVADREFFPRLLAALTAAPLLATVWQGLGAVEGARSLVGATFPERAAAGTVRGDFGQHQRRNLVHASDSVASAQREIRLWFPSEASLVTDYSLASAPWTQELPP